jgi:hypothetical protein
MIDPIEQKYRPRKQPKLREVEIAPAGIAGTLTIPADADALVGVRPW